MCSWAQVLAAHLLHELSKSQARTSPQPSAGPDGGPTPPGRSAEGGQCNPGEGSSKWHLYLEQLPRSYTTMVNWGAAEIDALQVDNARDAASCSAGEAKAQWRGILPLLRDLGESSAGDCRLSKDRGGPEGSGELLRSEDQATRVEGQSAVLAFFSRRAVEGIPCSVPPNPSVPRRSTAPLRSLAAAHRPPS